MVQPLLDGGFSTASRDADDRQFTETSSVISRQGLKRLERGLYRQIIGIIILGQREVVVGDDKVAHTLVKQVRDVVVSVACVGAQGEEDGLIGQCERTGVGEQLAHDGIFVDDTFAGYIQDVIYFCY